ncbi:MAG: DUF438 domain-containing protein [Methanomassiliicoccales archaeon]
MSEYLGSKEQKQELLKNIIKGLHAGQSVDEVKGEFQRLIKDVDASEIASMEQALIAEGMAPEAVTKLCDVHAAVFKEALLQHEPAELLPGHPLLLIAHENKELQKHLDHVASMVEGSAAELTNVLPELLAKLDRHYARKENIIFPHLEKHGITGPPAVMWSVDDGIRGSLKGLITLATQGCSPELSSEWVAFKQQAQEMIFKEENILGPMLKDILSDSEWMEIKEQFLEYGAIYSWPPGDLWQPDSGQMSATNKTSEGMVNLDTGSLSGVEINMLLTNLPIDITLVDQNDVVRYFSASQERIFVRTKSIIGRRVQNCHPPDSVHIVEKILSDFKQGRHDHADFWLQVQDKFIYIRYLALRNSAGEYMGTMEVTQDVTAIRQLSGDRRLLTYEE